jgi:hypothetical protein
LTRYDTVSDQGLAKSCKEEEGRRITRASFLPLDPVRASEQAATCAAFWVGDDTVHVRGPNGYTEGPPGVPHTIEVTGADERHTFITCVPAGFEECVRRFGTPALTDNDRPSNLGHAFDGPMPGHEPGIPVHYDLHAWVWRHNPAGGFAAWNSNVHCLGSVK